MIEGGGAVAERLMVDTLYYVGRAEGSLPRVAEVKRLYGLDALIPADFERASLTALDADALRALKEALVQAKQLWGQVVAGAPETLPSSSMRSCLRARRRTSCTRDRWSRRSRRSAA